MQLYTWLELRTSEVAISFFTISTPFSSLFPPPEAEADAELQSLFEPNIFDAGHKFMCKDLLKLIIIKNIMV